MERHADLSPSSLGIIRSFIAVVIIDNAYREDKVADG